MDLRKMLSISWKKAAIIALLWAVITSLIPGYALENPILSMLHLALSFLLPIPVGYLVTRDFSRKAGIKLASAAVNGAISGIVYFVVFMSVRLIEMLAEMLAGEVNILLILIVMAASAFVMLPLYAAEGAIGGAVYSLLSKKPGLAQGKPEGDKSSVGT